MWVIGIVVLVAAAIGLIRAADDPTSDPSATTVDISGLDDPLSTASGSGSRPAAGARVVSAAWSEPGQLVMEFASDQGFQVAVATERGGTYDVGPWSDPAPVGTADGSPIDRHILGTVEGGTVVRTSDGVAVIDAATGKVRWSTVLPVSGGSVIGDAVIVSAPTAASPQGAYVSLSAADGQQRWERPAADVGGLRAIDGHAVATRIDDADRSVTYDLLDDLGNVVHTSQPTCDGYYGDLGDAESMVAVGGTEVVVIATNGVGDGCSFRMDLATGEVRWRSSFPNEDPVNAQERIAGDGWVAGVTSDGSVVVLGTADGAVRTLGASDGNRREPLAVISGAVVVGAGDAGDEQDEVEVWDPATGERRWARPLPGGAALDSVVLHPREDVGATAAVSWSPSQVFLFSPLADDGSQTVELVGLDDGELDAAPVDLTEAIRGRQGFDYDDPRDGQIIRRREGVSILDPAGDDPDQVLVPGS